MQFAVGIDLLLVDFRGDVNESGLIGALGEVAIHRVVAEVRLPADEPSGERRVGVVEHLVERLRPIDQGGLLGPKPLAIFNGAAVKLFVSHYQHLIVIFVNLSILCQRIPRGAEGRRRLRWTGESNLKKDDHATEHIRALQPGETMSICVLFTVLEYSGPTTRFQR